MTRTGGGPHAVDEWVDLGQVRALADALLQVLQDWSDSYRVPSDEK
jgi:acetylornithine deacetylase